MMKFLSLIMIMVIPIMMQSTHPLTLGMTLLVQIIIVSFLIRLLLHSSWITLTMMLVMISGLMILFMYMTSVCTKDKINFLNLKMMSLYTFISLPGLLGFFTLVPSETMHLKDFCTSSYFKMFLPLNLYSSIFMFMYLLLALLIMINLMNNNKAPLRKKY